MKELDILPLCHELTYGHKKVAERLWHFDHLHSLTTCNVNGYTKFRKIRVILGGNSTAE